MCALLYKRERALLYRLFDPGCGAFCVFWSCQAEFGERVGYLNEYSSANPSDAKVDDLVADTKALSLSQRLVLVGLRQDGEMWAKLDTRRSRRAASTVQTAIIDLLDGTRQPEALSAQERTAVNAAMQSELKEVVGFSPLDATRAEMTRSQVGHRFPVAGARRMPWQRARLISPTYCLCCACCRTAPVAQHDAWVLKLLKH